MSEKNKEKKEKKPKTGQTAKVTILQQREVGRLLHIEADIEIERIIVRHHYQFKLGITQAEVVDFITKDIQEESVSVVVPSFEVDL